MDLRHQGEMNTEENQFMMKLFCLRGVVPESGAKCSKKSKISEVFPARKSLVSHPIGFVAGDGDHSLKKV